MRAQVDTKSGAEAGEASGPTVAGTQTLIRGLDLLETLRDGPMRLADLSVRLGLSRTTTYRLAAALTDRGYIAVRVPGWLSLGPKLLQLGAAAENGLSLQALAREPMTALAAQTGLCAFLGIRAGDWSLHLARADGRQRLKVATQPGDRRPITETGLGKALLLDEPVERLRQLHAEQAGGDTDAWVAAMQHHAALGYVSHHSAPEEAIRSIAAPARDAAGKIVGAISVASAGQYLADDGVEAVAAAVLAAAAAVTRELGGRTTRS